MNFCCHEDVNLTQFLINHFKLQQRINIGYILAGSVSVVIVILAAVAFSSISNDYRSYVSSSQKFHIDLLLTGQIIDIHRQAMIYTYQGHASAADQVMTGYENLLKQLDADLQVNPPKIQALLDTIRPHLKNYYAVFLQVKKQRDTQQYLIRNDFHHHASTIETLIRNLTIQFGQSSDVHWQFESILNRLLSAERNLYRYLDILDSSYVIAAKEQLNEAIAILENIGQQNHVQQNLIKEAIDGLERYRKSFNEVVQRTRGYLYLINVVMAAEAYEILYQSKKLSTFVAEEMTAREQAISAHVKEILWMLMVCCTALLVIMTLITDSIRRSIALPIVRLAHTFRALTEGSSQASIPDYPVNDEIGQLMHAATSFRKKNMETECLLQESMRLTHALESSHKTLEHTNEELEQVIHTVSHDLKSPLVTSMGFVSIMRKLADQGQYEQAVSRLDKITLSIARMEQLISDLLDFSRVGRIDLDYKRIDMNALLYQFAQTHEENLNRIGFTLRIHPNLPVIHGNESRILQLFENILTNAVKYALNEEQGAWLEIGAITHYDHFLIFCRDNGPGIEPAFQQKIFGLFYRLDNHAEGSGIGLAIVKKVMKIHGGDIWVESEPGQGACFWLRFPRPKTAEVS